MYRTMTMRHRDVPPVLNEFAQRVIGACIEVHRHLGPGLLEAAYETALSHELSLQGIPFDQQALISLSYKGTPLPKQRLDLLVAGPIVVEIKAIRRIEDAHLAQLVSYMRAGTFPLGLLINFNSAVVSKAIYRRINPAAPSAFSTPPRSNSPSPRSNSEAPA